MEPSRVGDAKEQEGRERSTHEMGAAPFMIIPKILLIKLRGSDLINMHKSP